MVMLKYESIFKIIATVNDIVFNKKSVLYNVFKKEKKNQQQENHSVRFSPSPFLAINRKKDRKRKGTN